VFSEEYLKINYYYYYYKLKHDIPEICFISASGERTIPYSIGTLGKDSLNLGHSLLCVIPKLRLRITIIDVNYYLNFYVSFKSKCKVHSIKTYMERGGMIF
jgi:hypothetical protein